MDHVIVASESLLGLLNEDASWQKAIDEVQRQAIMRFAETIFCHAQANAMPPARIYDAVNAAARAFNASLSDEDWIAVRQGNTILVL
jgi:hypothetical protein